MVQVDWTHALSGTIGVVTLAVQEVGTDGGSSHHSELLRNYRDGPRMDVARVGALASHSALRQRCNSIPVPAINMVRKSPGRIFFPLHLHDHRSNDSAKSGNDPTRRYLAARNEEAVTASTASTQTDCLSRMFAGLASTRRMRHSSSLPSFSSPFALSWCSWQHRNSLLPRPHTIRRSPKVLSCACTWMSWKRGHVYY